MKRVRTLVLATVVVAATVAACGGQDDDPNGAKQLWDKINAGAGFTSWSRAPNYATRTPSFTVHGRSVDVYVSPQVASALAGPNVITTWPVGSILVKDSFCRCGTREAVAVMEKRADGWFWAEYDEKGESVYSGKPKVCVDCHDNREKYSDWVYSFELPR